MPQHPCSISGQASAPSGPQERESRSLQWTPRFFRRTPDAQVHSIEYSDAECPLWEFNGKYLELEREAAQPTGEWPGMSSSTAEVSCCSDCQRGDVLWADACIFVIRTAHLGMMHCQRLPATILWCGIELCGAKARTPCGVQGWWPGGT